MEKVFTENEVNVIIDLFIDALVLNDYDDCIDLNLVIKKLAVLIERNNDIDKNSIGKILKMLGKLENY